MTKILQKYLFLLSVVLLYANVALAQVEKGKSRLDIGKKQATKTILSTPLKRFAVLKPMPKEVNINKPTILSQYFRNNLLNGSKAAKVNVSENQSKTESNSVDNPTVGDKLFANEKIIVSNIYPNPADDYTSVDYVASSNIGTASLTFYNILGAEVGSFDLDKNDRRLKISTTDWDSGIYLYQLNVDGKKLITKKFLVRHN